MYSTRTAVSHSFRIAVDMGTELLKKLVEIFTEKNVFIFNFNYTVMRKTCAHD